MRFPRHGGIYLVRWGSTSKTKVKTKSWIGTRPPPAGRSRPRQKNAPGGSRSFSSSADEFRPAIPRSGWSPPEPVFASPARTAYHALPAWHPETGTFYFAGKRNFLLCLDTRIAARSGSNSAGRIRPHRTATATAFREACDHANRCRQQRQNSYDQPPDLSHRSTPRTPKSARLYDQ
jgi:hypothetical protein